MKCVNVFILMSILNSLPSAASNSSIDVQQQIDHLLSFVASSNCQFQRNGSWHDAREAAEHIRNKYDYVSALGLVDTAEDFIKYSATESSFSGKKYKVKCGIEPEMGSASWLFEELENYRAQLRGG